MSIASNIVEGCARSTEAEYLRFLEIAFGSAREVDYQISLAYRFDYIDDASHQVLSQQSEETCKVLAGLLRAFR